MKFLIHSNTPNIPTGYGVQCKHLARRLRDNGHEVAVSSTYGHQGGVGLWEGVRLYPSGYLELSNDILHAHADHWFAAGADATPENRATGWIIPICDLWGLPTPMISKYNLAPWTPVDHSPLPPGLRQFFARNPEAIPIAMSRFGEKELFAAGLNPLYVPLAVDTKEFRPMPVLDTEKGPVDCRKVFGIAEDAFVVGMVAMNKGWSHDRKGFNEAFRAFGAFRQHHPDVVLFVHADIRGAEGINLAELALACGIPEHAIVWTNQYAYRLGLPPAMMAAAYSSMDVLLAPSHGEGFCVPLIEAQACGTPVVASDFSAQTELVGSGWLVRGQPFWDPASQSNYLMPSIGEIVEKLEDCYGLTLDERKAMSESAYRFAKNYDVDHVWSAYWVPALAYLEKIQSSEQVALSQPRTRMESVDIIVPLMREGNSARFLESLAATHPTAGLLIGEHGRTYAENVNKLYAESSADWILVVGDDVEFKSGWFDAAREVSDSFDVIGTNDTDGKTRNPDVAAGRHADHFFIRRAYIEELGSSLDGPGVVMPEAYTHWFTDKEVIELAKARKVFTPCLASVIVHHHPGYDGREDERQADPLYMKAVEASDDDKATFLSRLPLIQMARQ